MNPDTNRFEPLSASSDSDKSELAQFPPSGVLRDVNFDSLRPNGKPVPKHWTQFQVGELVTIKDYTFKVAYIGETAILLEPVGVLERAP